MTNREYLRSWERNHGRWERRAFNIVKTTVDDLYKNIPTDQINFENWEAVIRLNIPESAIRDMVLEIWRFAGRLGGEWAIRMFEQRIAKSGVPPGELEAKNAPLFNAEFNKLLAKYFITGVGAQHIKTMNETVITNLTLQLTRWLAQNDGPGYTFRELREKIREIAGEGYPAWMAARVARTEVTAAANWATLQSAKQNKYKVQKEWIAIDDRRTRTFDRGDKFDHLEMDGVLAAMNEPFEQRGVTLQFPGDPEAKPDAKTAAGMVINCRCTMAIVPVRDANGRLVLADARVPEIPKSQIPGTGDRPELLGLELTDYENKIRGLPGERGAFYDLDGNMLYEIKGRARSVPTNLIGYRDDLPPLDGRKGNAAGFEKIFTHNHPGFEFVPPTQEGGTVHQTKMSGAWGRKYYNSFSDSDVSIFGYYGQREIRAVTPDGRTFRLYRINSLEDDDAVNDPFWLNETWDKWGGGGLAKGYGRILNGIHKDAYWNFVLLGKTPKERADRYVWMHNNLKHFAWTKYFNNRERKKWYVYDGLMYNPDEFDWRPKGWKSTWKSDEPVHRKQDAPPGVDPGYIDADVWREDQKRIDRIENE